MTGEQNIAAGLVLQGRDDDFTTRRHIDANIPALVSEAEVCVWDSGVMQHYDWMEQPERSERKGTERKNKEIMSGNVLKNNT